MKGQLVFEFVVAAVLLFAIIIYSLNLLNINMTEYRNDYHRNDLEIRATQISELLVHNTGDYTDPIILGLSSGWTTLSVNDMTTLQTTCSNAVGYASLLESLDLLETPYMSAKPNIDFNITIQNISAVLVSCGDTSSDHVPTNVHVGYAKRFSYSEDGSILSIEVWTW